MRKLIPLFLLIPVFAMAQGSPFDGTWKVNPKKSQMSKKPEVYLLQNGMYSCKTCAPPYEVKADGTDQKVDGHPDFNSLSVKVVDDHNVEQVTKKDGKVMGSEKDVVSPDGKTLTINWTYNGNPEGGPITGKGVMKRVEKGPDGANLISGSWRNDKIEDMSATALTFTFKSNGDELTYSTPTGQGYTAKLNGGDAPYKGDPGVTSVSLKAVDDHTIEETDSRDGKVVYVVRISAAKDGKTITFDVSDKLHDTTSKWVAERQS